MSLLYAFLTPATQAQIEERAERSWKLRGMLHLGNLNAQGSSLDRDGHTLETAAPPMKPTPVTRPTPVGKYNFAVVEIVPGTWVAAGLPSRKQKGPKNQKWLTKAIVRDTNSGVLTWQEPLVHSPSMKLALVDKQLPRKDPRRLALQTASPSCHEKIPRQANARQRQGGDRPLKTTGAP